MCYELILKLFIGYAVRHVAGGNMLAGRVTVTLLVIEEDISAISFKEISLVEATQE